MRPRGAEADNVVNRATLLHIVSHCLFTDGSTRPVFLDKDGRQYVHAALASRCVGCGSIRPLAQTAGPSMRKAPRCLTW